MGERIRATSATKVRKERVAVKVPHSNYLNYSVIILVTFISLKSFSTEIIDCEWEEIDTTICSATCGTGGTRVVTYKKIVEESENGYCEKEGPIGSTVWHSVKPCKKLEPCESK